MKTSIQDTQSAISIGTDGLRLRNASRLWYRQAAVETENLPVFDQYLVRTTSLLAPEAQNPQFQMAEALAAWK